MSLVSIPATPQRSPTSPVAFRRQSRRHLEARGAATHSRTPGHSFRSEPTDTAGLSNISWKNRPAGDDPQAPDPDRTRSIALATLPSPGSAPRRAADRIAPAHPPHTCHRCGTQRLPRPILSDPKLHAAPTRHTVHVAPAASVVGLKRARDPAISTHESDRTTCKLAKFSTKCNKKKRMRENLRGLGNVRSLHHAPLQNLIVRSHNLTMKPSQTHARGGQ